jgi:hypothetical protein
MGAIDDARNRVESNPVGDDEDASGMIWACRDEATVEEMVTRAATKAVEHPEYSYFKLTRSGVDEGTLQRIGNELWFYPPDQGPRQVLMPGTEEKPPKPLTKEALKGFGFSLEGDS